MSKDDVAWIIVRSLGVVTLLLFIGELVDLLTSGMMVTIPLLLMSRGTFSSGQSSGLNSVVPSFLFGLSAYVIRAVIYGLLAFYLLKKGNRVHSLILNRLPHA
jgi:hypothetical protein